MGKEFFEFNIANPCQGCSAPCCKMVLINYPAPSTFMEMDYIRFILGFPMIKMILRNDGIWQVKVEQTCRFLDSSTNLCTVHGTSKQPKTCSYFNPHHCWYKRNFTKDSFIDLIEMDLTKYEVLLAHLKFDDEGKLTEIPSWEFINTLLKDVQAQAQIVQVQINGSESSHSIETQLKPLVESSVKWSVSK